MAKPKTIPKDPTTNFHTSISLAGIPAINKAVIARVESKNKTSQAFLFYLFRKSLLKNNNGCYKIYSAGFIGK